MRGSGKTLSEGLENVFEWSQFWNIMEPTFRKFLYVGKPDRAGGDYIVGHEGGRENTF